MNGKDNNVDAMIEMLSKKLGADKNSIKSGKIGNSVDDLAGKMSQADIDKIKSVMSDKAQMEKILNSKQAQMLIKKLSEGK